VPSEVRQTLETLRALQDIDRELWRVRDEQRRLPRERERRRAEIDAKLARVLELEKQERDLTTRVKEIEHANTGARSRLRKLEQESATCKDQAVLAAYFHEMRTTKRDLSEAEDEGLRLVAEAEELAKQRELLTQDVEAEEQVFADFAANAARELGEAAARERKLGAARAEKLGTGVNPEVLTRYERLLQSREGQAMAELDGRVCQACFMEVPPNVFVRLSRGIEVVSCPSCEVILYLRG
jgi:predicted  nucleic acid-binding Zn-ribbon protein